MLRGSGSQDSSCTCACFVVEEQTQTSRPPEELTGPKFEAFCTTTLLSESKMGGKPEKVYGNYDRNVSVQTQFCGEKLVWEFQVRQRLTGPDRRSAHLQTWLLSPRS